MAMIDPSKLTEQDLNDGLAEFGRMGLFLGPRLRDAEARLGSAEQDVTEYRKLASLVRALSEGYRARLAVVQAEKSPRPDG